ncbi:F-box/LRR-repeat protein At3g26922 isoform X1 [Lactuca sativa]|uniref:F-box domain-containing protein n=2 Tax=Lactuca sativa TaxID=4236 RepID=A0A9R1W2R8_LACSA|nr:F-box/LRR-repeat protein At3g26922 isoform X1 [Lactuca sativa]KAJ0218722.1 hypothetical protein LSAT_V11C300114090 [Lactuca sativa]
MQRMEFDQDNIRPVVEEEEDRLSRLPDEVIRNILSCIDMKFGVQTCLLSTRWKLVWTSIPCLKFSSWKFGCLQKFSEFVTNVLSKRNNQIQVSSINLVFSHRQDYCEVIVRKIANYAFSHNIQQLNVADDDTNRLHEFPACLFSSHSLKHFTLCNCSIKSPPTTPWDFPALTTLHLSYIVLMSNKTTKDSVHDNIFTKCVNLKDLTLEYFRLMGMKVFDIVAPRLSNLILIEGRNVKVVNVIAPQLENLTIIDTSLEYLNAPAGVSSLRYKCYSGPPLQLSKDGFHSLNQVNICCLGCYPVFEDARKIINILQELHSVKYLTLNVQIIECISSFPDYLSHLPSPFGNLICLNMDSHMNEDAYKVRMCSAARNFLFDNSPNATFTMDLPEETPGLAVTPIDWWRYVRKYTFTVSTAAIVDDSHVFKKTKKDKKKKEEKKLSRLDAVMVIQRAFRAYVIRRSQALCLLREQAVAKGEVLKDIWAC